jgi:hypothetical protein
MASMVIIRHGYHLRSIAAFAMLAALGAAFTRVAAQPEPAQTTDCNRPFPEVVSRINVPGGHPTPTRDGCWLFTMFIERDGIAGGSGISVLHRTGNTFEEVRSFPIPMQRDPPERGGGVPAGMALTRDQKVLVVSHGQQLTFLDVDKLRGGGDPVLGRVAGPRIERSWGVTITPDDKYVFATQSALAAVVGIDLQKAMASGFEKPDLAIIPAATRPVVPVASPDGRYLFATANLSPDVIDMPKTCDAGKSTEGVVQVIDVQKVVAAAAGATIAFAEPAGCQPKATTISPDGSRLSAVADGPSGFATTPPSDGTVAVFDMQPLREGKKPVLVGKVPVPSAPIGIVDTGSRLIVGFMPPRPNAQMPDLTIIDPSKAASGTGAIVGTIPAQSIDLAVSADRRTLFGAGMRWASLIVVDLARTEDPRAAVAPPSPASHK